MRNKYIKILNTDSQVVLHLAKYTYSNGVMEGIDYKGELKQFENLHMM